MNVECRPVRPEHATKLAELFAAAGVPCFCQFWPFGGDDNAWQLRCATEPEENRRALELEVRDGAAIGVVALADDTVVGWLRLAAAETVPKMFARRLYRAEPWFKEAREGVFMVGCTLVHPSFRKRGVASALVRASLEVARSNGATAIEALPRRPEPPVRDDALWNGPLSSFEAAGFRRVAGVDGYPVLRIDL